MKLGDIVEHKTTGESGVITGMRAGLPSLYRVLWDGNGRRKSWCKATELTKLPKDEAAQ